MEEQDRKQTIDEARRQYAEFLAELHEPFAELLDTVWKCEAKARKERWS
jgi:hypothetical protein